MRELFISVLFVFASVVNAQTSEIKPGDNASHYKLRVVTSKETTVGTLVSDLKGNIIVMQWWDRNCHGSKEILKSLNSFHIRYSNKILFYAVSNDPLPAIEKFRAKNKYTFSFCQDAAKLGNKYFPYTAKAHLVIINRFNTSNFSLKKKTGRLLTCTQNRKEIF
jgi:peroxiredoxin